MRMDMAFSAPWARAAMSRRPQVLRSVTDQHRRAKPKLHAKVVLWPTVTAPTLALFLPVVRGNTALFRGDDHGCSRGRAYARICRGLRPQNGNDQDGISL